MNEECDDGNLEGGDGCSPEMRVENGWVCNMTRCAVAGNGVLTAGVEECDDGNRDNDDGCSESMLIEEGYFCEPTCGPPSCCFYAKTGKKLRSVDTLVHLK